MPGKAGSFQVRLGRKWRDYYDEEDKILKRAFMAGFPECKFELRGQRYQYNFKVMEQINAGTGKKRDIRPPWGWKQPSKPIVPPGPTMAIKVPPGSAGTAIQVPHPKDKSQMITVNVPAGAKAGQAMLVPVPPLDPASSGSGGDAAGGGSSEGGGGGWGTGAKIAAGVAGAGLVVGGAVLGAAVAEHGVEGTADILADAAGDAGAIVGDAGDAIADAAADAGITDALGDAGGAIGDVAADAGVADALGEAGGAVGEFAGDAGDFLLDAGDTAGDFIMDLF
eukprot:TRINITY_DN20270_c0_g2_i3.p1 TRINITY_DN20270_c0_g2~~TRINITY_DN20270_c0_g2_i3.p1  ORF type:complete len:280 (-),score=81.72 TRINITY_DN20270_c0_g2_i3:578-1417(-)